MEFYSDGKVKSKGKYNEGKKDSIWMEYHSNGNIYHIIEYDNGFIIGRSKGYHCNGQLAWLAIERQKDESYVVSYYPNGKLCFFGFFTQFGENGIHFGYFKDGQIIYSVYKNGKLIKNYYEY